jgi:hypothetical protein
LHFATTTKKQIFDGQKTHSSPKTKQDTLTQISYLF